MEFITTDSRRKIMRAIKSTGTKDELAIGKAMWHLGLRYRKNNKKVYGSPDFTFTKLKIALFIDGEFFHGFNWEEKKIKIKSNREYWIPKIERNIKRDIEVNNYLNQNGWIVIRFWSKEIKADIESCLKIIVEAIEIRKQLITP